MSELPRQVQSVSVEARGLRRSYHGQAVLDGIEFKVEPGEIFVIMGPSGSGKTVLLKHLIGLQKPDAGEILIQGQPVNDSPACATSTAWRWSSNPRRCSRR